MHSVNLLNHFLSYLKKMPNVSFAFSSFINSSFHLSCIKVYFYVLRNLISVAVILVRSCALIAQFHSHKIILAYLYIFKRFKNCVDKAYNV